MNTRKFPATLFAIAFVCSAVLHAETSFSTPELDNDSRILFAVTHKQPGEISYSTLFAADLDEPGSSSRQLTTFPERLSLLSEGTILRIHNRYGTSQYSVKTGVLTHTSESATEQIPSGSVLHGAESASPDGKWICMVEKTGAATGSVVLKNASGYTETVLIPHTEFSYTEVPVKWSPDSTLLVYEKEGNIYFTEPEAMFRTSQIPENLRKIGAGSIHAVNWASKKNLVYISNDLVYKIPQYEMYTRALYSDFVGIGSVVGRLPTTFTSKDRFSVNSDCSRLLLITGNRTFALMTLPGTAAFAEQVFIKTEAATDGDILVPFVFWTATSQPVVWLQRQFMNRVESSVYSLVGSGEQLQKEELTVPKGAMSPLLSPDGKKLFFTDGSTAYVYAVNSWQQTAGLNCGRLVSVVWADSSTLYLGGMQTVRRWNTTAGGKSSATQILFPSSAMEYAWNPDTGRATVQADGGFYEYDSEQGVWKESSVTTLPPHNTRNGKYRAFLGSSPNSDFSNAPYVRNLTGPAVTRVMYTPAGEKKPTRKQVVLAFDATDNADGLSAILQTLGTYGIKATFFINGEFLRRYPAETKRIVQAGHECGSMFYTATDLTDAQGFVVDTDFVRRGLARNEDEFFASTGHELSLVWHAPFHKTNQMIQTAGQLAGYTYIEKESTPDDTTTLEKAVLDGEKYMTSAQIIEAIVAQLENGLVIPISTGISGGTRSDYLYDKLDLLIGAILDAGYDIVTAGSLHALELPVAGTSPQA